MRNSRWLWIQYLSQKLRGYGKIWGRRLLYFCAFTIIVVAILVSVARALAPLLDAHRSDLEVWASTLLKTPVKIKNLRVAWFKYYPMLSLNGVRFISKTTKQPVANIRKIGVLLDPVASIWRRKLVPAGIMIRGSAVKIIEVARHEYQLQALTDLGIKLSSEGSDYRQWINWLSAQPRLILRDIDLELNTLAHKTYSITLDSLAFQNSELRHTINGSVSLTDKMPTKINLAFDWSGREFDPATMTGQAFFELAEFSLARWLDDVNFHGLRITDGRLNTKWWLNWKQGKLAEAQTILAADNLKIYLPAQRKSYALMHFSGHFGWRDEANTRILAGENILLNLAQHVWPKTNFYTVLASSSSNLLHSKSDTINYPIKPLNSTLRIPQVDMQQLQKLAVGYLNLGDISDLLAILQPIISTDRLANVLSFNPRGEILAGQIEFVTTVADPLVSKLMGQFKQLGINPVTNYPGFKNLTGTINWNGRMGSASIDSEKFTFHAHKVFRTAVPFQHISGQVNFQHEIQTKLWRIAIPKFSLHNPDLTVLSHGIITLPPASSPELDLSFDFTVNRVKNIKQYLPILLWSAEVSKWLNNAFLSGELNSGQAYVKGKMADFPFVTGSGIFWARGRVKNIDLNFASDWPLLHQVDGWLNYVNNQLLIRIDHATTLGIPARNLTAQLFGFAPDAATRLKVQARQVATDAKQILYYVSHSPLNNTLGKTLADLVATGKVNLDLDLNVPLAKPEHTEVVGKLALGGIMASLPNFDLQLAKVGGMINFTRTRVESRGLNALLFHQPFKFTLTTLNDREHTVRAMFKQRINLLDLMRWLKLPLDKILGGSANIAGTIDFSPLKSISMRFSSDLVGTTLALPDIYAKSAVTPHVLTAEVNVGGREGLRVNLNYAKQWMVQLLFNRMASRGAALDYRLRNAKINLLQTPGHVLSQLNLELMPQAQGRRWNVRVASKELSGNLDVPANFARNETIVGRFDRLNIGAIGGESKRDTSSSATGSPLKITELPALDIKIEQFSYQHIPLGRVLFSATPASYGLAIQNLQVLAANFNLQARGTWQATAHGTKTNLAGHAVSNQLSRFLAQFGRSMANFQAARGELKFNLIWPNAPYLPNMSTMQGNASLLVGKGRIVDIGDQGAKMDLGKMLSIFSLQTIPRRLTLDFSDVFQKGYSFDQLRGDFKLGDGSMYTKNLHFDGPVAKVTLNGRIGLAQRDYDFILGVRAYVTASLPLAAATLINPVAGLGALAVNSVIGRGGMAVAKYKVTGSWAAPQWRKL